MALKPLLAGLLALPLLVACNTVNGLGQDVQAVGKGVSSAATYVQREVFSPRDDRVQTTEVTYREPSVTVGQACDPGGELSGGSGLPPCRVTVTRAPNSVANRSTTP